MLVLGARPAAAPPSRGVPPARWPGAGRKAATDGAALADHADLPRLTSAGAVFLDVRPAYEFAEGHLPGAVNLEFDLGDRQEIAPEKRAAVRALLGPDVGRPVVVYCRSFR